MFAPIYHITSMIDVKVAVVGEVSVGKTSIISHFILDKSDDQIVSTTAASFSKKIIKIKDQTFRIQIWDTAGQEKYRSLAPMYFRSADAVLVVFDVTRPKTLDEIAYWHNQVCQNGVENVKEILVANKIDSEHRVVAEQKAQQIAKRYGMEYIECSALKDIGIQEVFEQCCWKDVSNLKKNVYIDDVIAKPGKKCC